MSIGYTIDRLIRERGTTWLCLSAEDAAVLLQQAAQDYRAEMGHDSAPIRRLVSWLDHQLICAREGKPIDPDAWLQSLPPGLKDATPEPHSPRVTRFEAVPGEGRDVLVELLKEKMA